MVDKGNITDDIKKWLDELISRSRQRVRRYGRVKPIIAASDAQGRRFVAVGNRIYEGTWHTFPDFLRDCIWYVIGKEWFEAEVRMPVADQHPIMRWWLLYHEFAKKQVTNEEGLIDSVPNGVTKAFYQLAHDLYTLAHHQSLKPDVLRRLLTKDGFQGARYEIFVAATMIRAGFSLHFEDETDRRRRHVEFVAQHNDSGEKIAVEAKSRHRPGVLGVPGPRDVIDSIRLRLGRLINSAISKGHTHPLVVFVDMNLPAAVVEERLSGDDVQDLISTLKQVKEDDGRDLFNMILYTNHPFHYDEGDDPYDPDHLSLAFTKRPKYELGKPQLLEIIIRATKQFGNIPNEFPEEHNRIIG